MTTDFDLDTYLRQCNSLHSYLNQAEVWVPQKPRRPLPIADMDLAWRHNAANFLLRRAAGYAHRYVFGMVGAASAPVWQEVVGEIDGKPQFSGAVFSELDMMSERSEDAFDAEQESIVSDPEAWLKSTTLYRALIADLPIGEDRERLAELAKHWSSCPARAGAGECRCEEIRAESNGAVA